MSALAGGKSSWNDDLIAQVMGRLAYSRRPFEEVQGIPREEALLAVSLDNKDAMAHAILAHMLMWGSEWEGAIAEARTALALNPNSAFVISMLGCVLGFGGYRDEAFDRLRRGHACQSA